MLLPLQLPACLLMMMMRFGSCSACLPLQRIMPLQMRPVTSRTSTVAVAAVACSAAMTWHSERQPTTLPRCTQTHACRIAQQVGRQFGNNMRGGTHLSGLCWPPCHTRAFEPLFGFFEVLGPPACVSGSSAQGCGLCEGACAPADDEWRGRAQPRAVVFKSSTIGCGTFGELQSICPIIFTQPLPMAT
jgi:hypothetical protein